MLDWSSFVAGSVAGATGIFVGHPFDSLKVRVQVGETLRNQKFDAATIRQLYRGITAPLLTTGTTQSINFALYERFKRQIHTNRVGRGLQSNELYSLSTTFWAGVGAGSAISVIVGPIGMVKLQQQVVSETGIAACVRELYRRSGLRVFYRSYFCTFILEAPGRGVYLWTYENVKTLLAKAAVVRREGLQWSTEEWESIDTVSAYKSIPFSLSALAGASAGIFSWFVVYPFDVIKSRMQRDAHRQQFSSTMQCVRDTWAAGGVRSLYRGIGYTLIRAGPVAASVLPVYDVCKGYIDREFFIVEYTGFNE